MFDGYVTRASNAMTNNSQGVKIVFPTLLVSESFETAGDTGKPDT